MQSAFCLTECRIIDHCIRKRLHWNTCFARKVCKEGEYYEEMMRYLRKNLAVRTGTKISHLSTLFTYITMVAILFHGDTMQSENLWGHVGIELVISVLLSPLIISRNTHRFNQLSNLA